MEWTPSDKMSTTDLRAVLMSWGVPTLSSEKRELIAQVSKHYKLIMREWVSHMPPRTAITIASCAAASSGGSDKGVGTDTPAIVTSYIGSEEAADDDQLITNTLTQMSITNDVAASAAAPEEDADSRKETRELGDDARDELEYEQSAACAGEDVPDRWAVLSNEIALKITKDPKAKAPAKEKKASGKLYGYLPIGGVIIDYDQKKHGDNDPGDVVT